MWFQGALSDPATLVQAHIARASTLVICVPDGVLIRQLVDTARQLNSSVKVLVHGASLDDAQLLQQELQIEVLVDEQELAKGMARQVLDWALPKGASSGH